MRKKMPEFLKGLKQSERQVLDQVYLGGQPSPGKSDTAQALVEKGLLLEVSTDLKGAPIYSFPIWAHIPWCRWVASYAKEPKVEPDKPWEPNHGEKFYYIDSAGDIRGEFWVTQHPHLMVQKLYRAFLGIYRTYEEAQDAVDWIRQCAQTFVRQAWKPSGTKTGRLKAKTNCGWV